MPDLNHTIYTKPTKQVKCSESQGGGLSFGGGPGHFPLLDFLQMSQATEKHHSPHDSDRVPFRGRSRPTSHTQHSLQSSRDQAKGSVFSTVQKSDLYSKNASSSLPGLKGGKTPNRGDAGPRCSAKTLHCAWQSPSSNNTPSHSQRGSIADVGRWRFSFLRWWLVWV